MLTVDRWHFYFLRITWCILIQISLNYTPNGPIENKPSLVQVKVKLRTGDNEAIFTPQPLSAHGYCLRPSGQAARRSRPVSAFTSTVYHISFPNLARTCIALRTRTSSIMEALPHQIYDNGPSNVQKNFGIPWFIFQPKVTKCGTDVGLKILIKISSGFNSNSLWRNFQSFSNFVFWKWQLALSSLHFFLGSFSNGAKTFIVLRSQTSSIMAGGGGGGGGLLHLICAEWTI